MAILPCVEGLAAVSVQESRLFVRRRQSSVQIAVESGTRSGFVDPRPLIDAQRTEAQQYLERMAERLRSPVLYVELTNPMVHRQRLSSTTTQRARRTWWH